MPSTSAAIWNQVNIDLKDVPIINSDASFIQILKPGHKINKPNPLFKKLDEAQLKAFKEQFAGEQGGEKTKQKSKKKTTSTHTVDISPKSAAEVAELESQVSKQGELVRKLKSEKADPSEIKKEVEKLLSLKKEVLLAKGESPADAPKKSKKKSNKKK